MLSSVFIVSETASTEIYTYGQPPTLHGALPISTDQRAVIQVANCSKDFARSQSDRRGRSIWEEAPSYFALARPRGAGLRPPPRPLVPRPIALARVRRVSA